jgi:hypothetical protein
MTSQMELLKLCKKIKGLIPSKHVEQDATEPYQSFLNDLVADNIDPHEVECIKRAHNYFNFILNSNDLVSLDSEYHAPGQNVSHAQGSRAPTPSVIPKLNTDEERLQLLIELYLAKDSFKDTQTKAILDMQTLSESIIQNIPKLDLTWTNLKPPEDTVVNPLVDRFTFQVELAKELNTWVPCQELIVETENTLFTTKNIVSTKPDPSLTVVKQQEIVKQDAVTNKRTMLAVSTAQEKVKLKVKEILQTLT